MCVEYVYVFVREQIIFAQTDLQALSMLGDVDLASALVLLVCGKALSATNQYYFGRFPSVPFAVSQIINICEGFK